MKQCRWLTVIMALWLAGCVVRGKPQAKAVPPPPQLQAAGRPQGAQPAPRPEPLSIPQTQAQLPPAQPIDPEALAATQPPSPPVETQAPPRAPRRTAAHPAPPPRAEPAPAGTQSAAQAAAPESPPATENEVRGEVQEIIPPEELKRLRDSLAARKLEIHRVLDPAQTRKLNKQQSAVVSRIQSFLQQSEEAEKRGDWRQADTLGERAQVLAREFQGGGK
jgi:hypothetical protein